MNSYQILHKRLTLMRNWAPNSLSGCLVFNPVCLIQSQLEELLEVPDTLGPRISDILKILGADPI